MASSVAALQKRRRNKILSKIITSVGNFSVQYNFQAISVALILMSSTVCTLHDDDKCDTGKQVMK
jgi:hypothetical protein